MYGVQKSYQILAYSILVQRFHNYWDGSRHVLRSIPYKLTRNKKLHVNGLLKINKEME